MIQGMFDSSTLPVLEQVVNFSQARHNVLAGISPILIRLGIVRATFRPTSFSPS